MLQINEISFGYNKKRGNLFSDFSLNLQAGNVYGLLGKNGAGKSTLIYLMTGLLTPQSGEALMDGENVRKRLPKTMSDIFLVPEEFDLPRLSIKQYVSINAPFYPNFSMEDMQRYLDIFEMSDYIDVNMHSLSMGQKKKVFMAFAFATNTRVLIMDEPTNGLDIPSKSQFRKLVGTGMSDDRMMLISTHQVRDISDILDHVVIIDNSKVLLNASFADVTSKLAFRPLRTGDEPLFVVQSPFGPLAAVPAESGEETAVDLEMLFNATLQNPEAINNLFTAKN
ncbi:MAG: ABC transporter ATP-binding protein [Muribaculaceae bacterium]|nr:ABC transporter ATP-binding protein [Muribaculaceae bacterium]MBQ7205835.1 ABC transporter ATP-binding protein [Muribaculaceae bacterium]